MQRDHAPTATVAIGDLEVAVTRRRGGRVHTARILGREPQAGGGVRLYLDRLVHNPWEHRLGAYACSGAISTILEGPDGGSTT